MSSGPLRETDPYPGPMSDRRQHLLETAARLFQEEGFHSVGIDRVLSEAGVAKMTLYRHFASKEELIVSCVEHYSESRRLLLEEAWERSEVDPRAAVLELFDALCAKASDPNFPGCPTQQAAGEFPGREHPVHQAAARCKAAMRDGLRDLAARCGVSDPKDCATVWFILAEGVLSVGCTLPGEDRRDAVRAIVEQSLGRP